MLVTTIKELKAAIQNLPDDLKVYGFNGHDYLSAVMVYKPESTEAFIVSHELPAMIGNNWVVEEQGQ